jgi:hypothetical protein
MSLVIGADLGTTKITALAVETRNGEVAAVCTLPLTPFINWQDRRTNQVVPGTGQTYVERALERAGNEGPGTTGCRLAAGYIRVYQDLGGAELRAAIELISPANKDRAGSRRTFAAQCAGYLKHGIAVVIVDIVTARSANLHAGLFETLGVKSRRGAWHSSTGLYAVAYRAVTTRKSPRVEAWPEQLTLDEILPTLPLWLALDLCVPVRLEDSYLATCQSLRISA